LEVHRKRLDADAIDGYLQQSSHDQRTISVTESGAQTAGVHTLVDTIDSDPDIAMLHRHALDHNLELVCLELGAITVIRVGKPPRRLVTRSAGFDGETPAQMANRSFAALTVLAEQVAPALG